MVTIARRIAGIVLVVLALVVFAALVLPKLFGWSGLVVTSGSMSPTFDTGSVVVVEPIAQDQIHVRDIVSFRDASGGYTTHRIVGMESGVDHGRSTLSFTTKGDANEDADPQALDPRNVVGKARFAVPHLGYVVAFIKTPLGAGLLALLFLFVMFSGGDRRRRPRESSAGPDVVPASDVVAARS